MTEDKTRKPVAVIGIGNVLFADDGFGMAVLERLRGEALSEGVDLVDGSTLGIGLIEYLKDYRAVIIVDAAEMDLAPGTLRTFRPRDVRSMERGTPLSLHSTDILGAVELAVALNLEIADIHVIAVQPEALEIRATLSPSVSAAIPSAVAAVRETIRDVL